MNPDRDTMLCLDAIVRWHGQPTISPSPIEAQAIAALAQRILREMHADLDQLNHWADQQAEQRSELPF